MGSDRHGAAQRIERQANENVIDRARTAGDGDTIAVERGVEPTAGVDIEIRRSMWEFMQRINAEGTTIILTTHYLEEAENLCRHVAIIDEGRIIENAPMGRVLRKLQRETFVLSLKEPVAALPDLAAFEAQLVDDAELEVSIHAGQDLNEVFGLLSNNGIAVQSMRNKSNRLEELFMDLVENKQAASA